MTKKNDLDSASLHRETEKFNLTEVALTESSCKVGDLRDDELPTIAKQATKLSITLTPDATQGFVIASFNLNVNYKDSSNEAPPLLVHAVFRLDYTLSKPISKKHLKKAFEQVSASHVWPFWKEFAQSMIVRMGLPPFNVPKLNLSNFRDAN